MEHWYDRTETLLGPEALSRLGSARVLVAGVGGVGGYAAEMLARTGVGHLTIVDADNVAVSNINRQLIALHDTVGLSKVQLFAHRFREINPDIKVTPLQQYITPENVPELLGNMEEESSGSNPEEKPGCSYDYVIDAIDTVAPKMALITYCLSHRIPIISSMGAGGRVDPTRVGYFDISETREDGLARVVRQRLRKAGIRRALKVVASTEAPRRHSVIPLEEANKRSSFGTIASIPAIFGILLANKVLLDLINLNHA